ncbi:MAG TPA: helix-turn-helix domain-containing protein [Nocardioides sp.]|nr:helix-turn-helix domain-containing protein [Nocardioides sp.]
MPDPDRRHRFVERLGAALTDAGLQRLPARVFAALVIDEDGRMTAAEIAEAVGASPASVSTAVNYLGQISFLHRERERGSRRDVYVVDDDAWLQALRRERLTYGPMIDTFSTALDGMAEDDPARRRLLLMREFLHFVEEELDAMGARWEERKRSLGLG